MSVMLVPLLKDKSGRLNSMGDYQPIALASVLSKVLERIKLTKLEMHVLTSDNQFGFKGNMELRFVLLHFKRLF